MLIGTTDKGTEIYVNSNTESFLFVSGRKKTLLILWKFSEELKEKCKWKAEKPIQTKYPLNPVCLNWKKYEQIYVSTYNSENYFQT